MVISINIDTSRSQPVKKKAPERGPLTFLVGIEQGIGPAKFTERRNLSRGNNLLTEPPKGPDKVFKDIGTVDTELFLVLTETIFPEHNFKYSINTNNGSPPPSGEDAPYVDPEAVKFSLLEVMDVGVRFRLPLEDTMVTTPDDAPPLEED